MVANLTTKLGQLVDVLTPDTTNTRIGVANASPTRTLDVTGTFGASGASTLGGALTYGGVTLSNAVTGTGNMVLSASPTLTGTLTGAAANFSGNGTFTNSGQSGPTSALAINSANPSFGMSATGQTTDSKYWDVVVSGLVQSYRTVNDANTSAYAWMTVTRTGYTAATVAFPQAINYGGVTLSNSVTGTGSMVLSASPTLTGTLTAATVTASGRVTGSTGGTFGPTVSGGSAVTTFISSDNSSDAIALEVRQGRYNKDTLILSTNQTNSANFLNVIENGSSKFTISTNGNTAITGNLGIGMTPSNILDITQTQNAQSIASLTNANASTAAIATFRTKNDAGSVCELGMFGSGYTPSGVFRASGGYVYANGAGGLTLTTGAAQPIYFGVNNAEVARFDTGGSLLINTSTTGGWPGNSKLEVKTTATSNTISAWNASSGGTAFLSRVDNTAVSCLTFYYGASTQISYWSTNGSTSTFNNPSDIRFKTVAEKQFDYSGPIKAMQMVDFNWTETGASDFGGLAQQAYEAFADTPIRDVLVSKPQNPEDKWFMAPDYYGRIALWGVKDLYAENEALKATVANLTARLEALENK